MSRLPANVRFIERDWLSANHILLFGQDGATIVDTGYVKHVPLMLALIEHALSSQPPAARHIRHIVNTHLHSDHCGGNQALQQRYGCTIQVPSFSMNKVRDWDEDALTYRRTAQQCPRFSADSALAPGACFDGGGLRWQAHSADGHDPDSLMLFEPENRLLISADALWASGFGIIFPEIHGDSGFAEQRESLALIESLDPRCVLPGHGPMFDDVAGALQAARRRLDAMIAEPARHARHALKALLKFHMLDVERATVAELLSALAGADILHQAGAQLDMAGEASLLWAMDQLVAGGQMGRDGEAIWNID